MKDGERSAFQLDGVIHRTGSDEATMLFFCNCHDFEFFSGNSKGAIQGYGREIWATFPFNPFAFIDSPSFYLTLDTVDNGEIYNIIMRGPSTLGGTDATDVWGSNNWIHDIEATNGDESVTVKNPASNFLIESIYCNLSGGSSIGSLSTGTDFADITYRHIYANNADPCFIKSNGGNGTVQNVLWDTVTVRNSAYPLSIDSEWESETGEGDGVQYTNFTFKNWHVYNDESARPNIRLWCPAGAPCSDIILENVNLWTEDAGSYSTNWVPNDFTTELLANSSFTIPPVPTTTSFYPGLKPSSSLLHLSVPGGLASGSASASRSAIVSSRITSTPLSQNSQTTSTSSELTTTSAVTTTMEPHHGNRPPPRPVPMGHDHVAEHLRKHNHGWH
ncbi:pectin lyase-like protein [Penicillium sp. IBT 16267x]|nr:pectin lyase-like protein [Penicillium sp. IBT 16267x]